MSSYPGLGLPPGLFPLRAFAPAGLCIRNTLPSDFGMDSFLPFTSHSNVPFERWPSWTMPSKSESTHTHTPSLASPYSCSGLFLVYLLRDCCHSSRNVNLWSQGFSFLYPQILVLTDTQLSLISNYKWEAWSWYLPTFSPITIFDDNIWFLLISHLYHPDTRALFWLSSSYSVAPAQPSPA